jgi:phosphohistidine phosphatase
MKTLLLLRHAKSSWSDPAMRDFDRTLNERGLKAAPLMGEFIKQQGIKPDLIISSPAERARQTMELVKQSAGLNSEIRFDERIYEASVGRLMQIVSGFGERANEVLLVGHNNGLENLLARLTGEDKRMPTAALARISLPIDNWSDVYEIQGQLNLFVKPKDLSGE